MSRSPTRSAPVTSPRSSPASTGSSSTPTIPGLNIRVLNLSFGTALVAELPARPAGVRGGDRLGAGHRGRRLGRQRRHHGRAACPTRPSTRSCWRSAPPTPSGTKTASDDTVTAYSSRGDGTRNPYLVAPGQHVASLRVPGSFIDQQFGARPGVGQQPVPPRQRHLPGGRHGHGRRRPASPAAPGAHPRPGQVAPDRHRRPAARSGPGSAGSGEVNVAKAIVASPSSVGQDADRPPPAQAHSKRPEAAPTWYSTAPRSPVSTTSSAAPSTPPSWPPKRPPPAAWTGGTWNGNTWTGGGLARPLLARGDLDINQLGRFGVDRPELGRRHLDRAQLGQQLLDGTQLGHIPVVGHQLGGSQLGYLRVVMSEVAAGAKAAPVDRWRSWPGPGAPFRRRLAANAGRRVQIWTIIAILAAAAGLLWRSVGEYAVLPIAGPMPWFLAVMFGLAEVFVLHIQVRREAQAVSLSEIPLILGLFFATPSTLLLARLIGPLIALVLYRHQRSVTKIAFNMALFAADLMAAVAVFRLVLGGRRPPRAAVVGCGLRRPCGLRPRRRARRQHGHRAVRRPPSGRRDGLGGAAHHGHVSGHRRGRPDRRQQSGPGRPQPSGCSSHRRRS